ncbi:leucine- [Prionailurus iriomotensis]
MYILNSQWPPDTQSFCNHSHPSRIRTALEGHRER